MNYRENEHQTRGHYLLDDRDRLVRLEAMAIDKIATIAAPNNPC